VPYPSRGAWQFHNVSQSQNFWPVLESINVEELHPDGLSTFSCNVLFDGVVDFDNEDRVWVKFDGNKIWGGHIRVMNKTFLQNQIGIQKMWELEGQDYTAKLDDSVVVYERDRPRETAASRVAFILDSLNFNLTTGDVNLPSESVERANYENMTVGEALRQVADELILHLYVDFGPDDGGPPGLHMFRSETLASPFDLTDSSPNFSTTFPYSELVISRDSQDLKTAVHVVGDKIRRWVPGTTIGTYGRQEIGITDLSLRTEAQLLAAGNRVLDQNDRPEIHGTVLIHEPGMRAGMRFGLVNTPWGINTNYFVEQVAMEAPDPHDEDGKALLFTRLSFTDKRRVGRMPGGGRRRDRTKKGDGRDGGDSGAGDSGGTQHPPGTGGGTEPNEDPDPPEDTGGEFLIENWTRLVGSYPADVGRETLTSTGTSHAFPIPGGGADGDCVLLFYVTTEDANTMASQFSGWHLLESVTGLGSPATSGGALAFFITAGDNPGTSVTVTTPGSETVLGVTALIQGGPLSTADISHSQQTNTNATPSVSGWTGENELAFTVGADSQAVAGGSIGLPYVLVENLVSGFAGLRIHEANVTGAINPPDYTSSASGEQFCFTLALRYHDPEWGRLPYGQGVQLDNPWEGGNTYVKVSSGSATVSGASGAGTISMSSTASVSMMLRSDAPDDDNGEPWEPWADGDARFRIKWKVNPLGSTGNAHPQYLEFQCISAPWRGQFRINLGDAATWVYQTGGDEVGVVVGQTASEVWSDFVPKTLAADTYYWTICDFRDTRVRMKTWAYGSAEPVAWDIDVAKVDEDLGEDDVSQWYITCVGISGMVFSFDEEYAQTTDAGSGGQEPGDEDLPLGDGTTTTWTLRPWVGPIWLYVDGILTEPASKDPVAGTVTFDRAPSRGAYIVALYTAA